MLTVVDSVNEIQQIIKNYTGGYAPIDYLHKNFKNDIKPSEGSITWIPVRWTLEEWLNGSEDQDKAPYLMGYINSLRSAMSYTDSLTLNDFKQ